jgi:hypothetical protein
MEKTGPRKQKGEPTETRGGERSRVSVWVMSQVTLRVRDPNELMEKQEGERSEGNLGMTMHTKA